MLNLNGVLLVDKPAGWTSHDVVAKVRRIASTAAGQKVKVGHSGTLDPSATGLLVLLLGNYTKRASEFSKLDKTYEAEITMGAMSTTGDKEGEITRKSDKRPPQDEIEQVINRFKGKILQTPHAYSAVKVDGRRAYKLARAGKEVKLEPREVTIYQLLITNYQYPELSITARVSSGTYIRSLVEDIGKKLGTGAYLSALRRTQVGNYDFQDAVSLKSVANKSIKGLLRS